jgi:serine/threonine-protein kinase
MGAVYSAVHTLLGRAAAVKILLPELSRDQEVVTRFFNEARAAAAIRHPSIVEIYDFGWHTDGSAYLVMEHLRGESLAARLARGRMSVAGVMMAVRQIAGALAAAHRIGIVHRDLKPENIFLVPDPEVAGGERIKLLDFGIAKLVADNDQHRMTRPGAILGTPTYMAPEQCRGEPVDHRADLYSLGCITFELCTGRPPFIDGGVGGVLSSHVHEQPLRVSSLAADIPPVLDDLVQRLLVKDLLQRVQAAEAVVQAIDAATDSVYSSGGRPVVLPDAGRPDQLLATTLPPDASGDAIRRSRPSTRHKWFAGIGAAGAIGALLATGTIWAFGHRRDPDSPPPPAAQIGSMPRTPVVAIRQEAAVGSPIDAGDVDAPESSVAAQPARTTSRPAPPNPPAFSDEEPPPGGLSAQRIAELYVAVGQQLKVLGEDRGAAATEDLWPLFRLIRIHDAIIDPEKRDETERVLRQLRDQVIERSR